MSSQGDSRSSAFAVIVITVILAVTSLVSYALFRMGYSALFAGLLPALFAAMLIFSGAPKVYALVIFLIGYLIVSVWIYIPSLKPGIIFDVSLGSLLFLMFTNTIFGKVNWLRGFNGATFFAFIWLIYCCLELFNLSSSREAWMVAVRWMAVYLFFIVFLTPIQLTSIKNFKVFVYAFSVLSLVAVLWIFRQKYFGLNQAELIWLSDPKVHDFHVLPFGIRYWSFLTDAANAAVCLALSGSFFGVLCFFANKRAEKYYFAIISALSLIASLFTGTRSHVVIPFVALMILIICSKNKKILLWSVMIIVGTVIFFRYTNIGDSNTYVWRARSAFHFEQDASYLLRQDNHRKLRVLMRNKPFGVGLGMSEQKALKYNSESEIAKIPTDSWIYTVYVETGIVGVLFYVFMFLYVIVYGIRISLNKIKNRFIRGVTISSTGCVAGILVASYGNGILAQFPNGIVTFTLIGVIFAATYVDDHLSDNESNTEDGLSSVAGNNILTNGSNDASNSKFN